jgi:hypothetical protein
MQIGRWWVSKKHCLVVVKAWPINQRLFRLTTSSGGLAVKRITSNDEIPGSSPGRSFGFIKQLLFFPNFEKKKFAHMVFFTSFCRYYVHLLFPRPTKSIPIFSLASSSLVLLSVPPRLWPIVLRPERGK